MNNFNVLVLFELGATHTFITRRIVTKIGMEVKIIEKRVHNWNSDDFDSKIGNQKLCRWRFRNRQQNCIAADLEIGSQKLCRYQFRNQEPKTASLPIQKSVAKNCVATNSEIRSQKLHRYRFRNQQPKTTSLLIQISAAKLCRCRFLKSAVIMESFRLYFSLFLGVYNKSAAEFS
jgi:hypothetical protein